MEISENVVVKECGMIDVSNNKLTAEAQTYPIVCGAGGNDPMGSRVRVRLENTNKPLMIAEISVTSYVGTCLEWVVAAESQICFRSIFYSPRSVMVICCKSRSVCQIGIDN